MSFLKSHPAAAVCRAAAASAVLDMHPFVLGDEKQLSDVVLCRAAAVLSSAEALGIDVEWRPTGSRGGGQKASILQVPHALPHVLADLHQASYTASLLPFCACCKAQRSLTSTHMLSLQGAACFCCFSAAYPHSNSLANACRWRPRPMSSSLIWWLSTQSPRWTLSSAACCRAPR